MLNGLKWASIDLEEDYDGEIRFELGERFYQIQNEFSEEIVALDSLLIAFYHLPPLLFSLNSSSIRLSEFLSKTTC